MLANLSHEIVGIREHDGSRVFDPARWAAVALAQVETMQPQSVLAVCEPRPDYETKPVEPSDTQE